jgi:hypothetical protein
MDACPRTGEQLLTYSIEDGTAPQPRWKHFSLLFGKIYPIMD